MDVSAPVRWLRRKILAEIHLLRAACTIKWPDKASLARLREFLADGGVSRTCDLVPNEAGGPRVIRLLVQLDGDTMLTVPTDFGAHPNDTVQMASLEAGLSAELGQLHAALPYNWASLIAVVSRFGFLTVTLYSLPGAVLPLIGLAPADLLASMSWWHLAGTLCGPLEMSFGWIPRRGAARLLEWTFQRAVRPQTQ